MTLCRSLKRNYILYGAEDLQKIYFDEKTKLVVKVVYKDYYIEYKNIELNKVTDNDFVIPSNIVITDKR